MAEPEQIERLFQQVRGVIEREEESFDNGEEVNLDSLEGHARRLCTAIAELPKEQGKAYDKELRTIMSQLSLFAEKLVNQQNTIRFELESLNKQSKAQTAYKKNNYITTDTKSE